jgi:hypothetical protein
MAYFAKLTNDGFKGCLVDGEMKNIEELSLHALAKISPDMFFIYMYKANNIKVLKLFACYNFVTNTTLQTIFENLVWLEELVLEGATRVTNIGFLGRSPVANFRITRLTNLRRANFSGMLRLNSMMLSTVTNHTLQYLNISKCPQITTDGVKMLLRRLPSLELLNLKNNPQIDYVKVLNEAAEQIENTPRLKDILLD